jgi:hypothetical protein
MSLRPSYNFLMATITLELSDTAVSLAQSHASAAGQSLEEWFGQAIESLVAPDSELEAELLSEINAMDEGRFISASAARLHFVARHKAATAK